MHERPRAWVLYLASLCALLASLAIAKDARAAGDDAVAASVDKILAQDFANANYGDARKKLRGLAEKCKKQGCSAGTQASIHRALGLVSSQIGQKQDAANEFLQALESDPQAQLPADATDAAKASWADAQKAWLDSHPQPDDATKAGWTSKQGFELAKQAVAAEASGNFGECVERDRAALTLEEHARARLHLSGCEGKAAKVIDGLRDAQKALQDAGKENDEPVAKAAQARIEELLPRVAHVSFEVPAGVSDVRVAFDDKPVPNEKLGAKFSIDPGKHHVQADGTVRGAMLTFSQDYEVKDGESLVVKLTLKPTALTSGQLECMFSAKTQEDILKCLPQEQKPLVVRAGLDVGAYGDTTHVYVLSPEIRASITSPTAGWNVGASYLVDVVTAASPDIVSEASRSFRDVRQAATVGGGYKPGLYGAQLGAFYSREYDYASKGGSIALSGDFFDKQLTPQIAYTHVEDTIGRTNTDFDVFSHSLATNELLAGATIIMSKSSILVLGATLQFESGDQSKPYRYVPMFAPGTTVPVGAPIAQVNQTRLEVRPLEQLPLDRERYALAARYALRANGSTTLRLEERVYTDTWGIKASTSDGRYVVDLSRKLSLWPHAHFHAQTGASFYQRVYDATVRPDGTIVLPAFRTDDRELSPLVSLTLGGGARYAFARPEAKFQYGISLQGDLMGTRYINALFIKYRLAYYGTLGFDVEFE